MSAMPAPSPEAPVLAGPSPSPAPDRGLARLGKFVLRDSAIVAAAVAAWWLAGAKSAGQGPAADVAGVVCGLLGGAVAFVLHEWGHLLAGLLAGGNFPVAKDVKSAFLFDIDPDNSIRQFTVMSLGGFAVTALGILFVYTQLPDDYLATRVVRGVVMFLASLTVFLEFPLLAFTIWSGEIPEVASVSHAPAGGAAPSAGTGTTTATGTTTSWPDGGERSGDARG